MAFDLLFNHEQGTARKYAKGRRHGTKEKKKWALLAELDDRFD